MVSSSTTEIMLTKLHQTFAALGLPHVLVSDNGTCFTSCPFEQFCQKNGIEHIVSAPYHPAGNGLAERAVQTIKAGLRKSTSNLEDRLYRLLPAYRITTQTTTGQSVTSWTIVQEKTQNQIGPGLTIHTKQESLKNRSMIDSYAIPMRWIGNFNWATVWSHFRRNQKSM